MTARIIDGKAIAAELRGKVMDTAHRLARDRSLVPGLAVVLVGVNPASEVYVASKTKATIGSGMRSFDPRLPETTGEAELVEILGPLNADPVVHGILLQLPLPAHIDAPKVIAAIDPARTSTACIRRIPVACWPAPALAPCTPLGCVILAKSIRPSSKGSRRWSSAAPTSSASRWRTCAGGERHGHDRAFQDR
jgi:methylenetetrahydrofolate dehydrogenase (NADP+)/methenyltetrahydrofolate cyclohydrolase